MCLTLKGMVILVIYFATLFFYIDSKYSAVETKSLHLLVFEICALFHCKNMKNSNLPSKLKYNPSRYSDQSK